MLVVMTVHAENVTDDTEHQQTGDEAAISKEEAARQATREAIRRAVLGGHQQERVVKRYETISHTEIDEYVGSWVKLETYFGRKVEGTLQRVDGDKLYVDEHLERGSAIYPVDRQKLSKLKVLR